MKIINWLYLLASFVFLTSSSLIADEINSLDGDKTLSPYFFVESDDPEVDRLPLYSTSADVKIRGVIADVTVTQVYQNTGKKPLEAIYIFPMSTRAAVYAMTMKIEDRVLRAEIKEKQEARQIYEDAKNSGFTASLLEQHRPNVFQMNVANIMPGDSLIVELKYTELLVPEERVYEFVYPTVVGPRYSNTPVDESDGTEDYVETPYTPEGKDPSYKFDINIEILSGMALTELKSPSHELDVNRIEPDHVKATLKAGQENSGNKDFILRYSLASNQIKTGLLLSENGKEKFFLLMLQPPKRVEQRDITNREYIFVIDVSGSMYGFPLDVSKKMMKSLLSKLTPNDKFNVLLFAGGSSFMSCESMIATPENINRAMALIDKQQGGGSTELLTALNKVMSFPLSDGYSRIVTILTDGYVSVEPETYDLIRDNLDKASFFAFGIGSSVNRTIIEGIGTVGMGESFVITKPDEADQIADRYIKYIESPIMTDINLETEGFLAYDIIPKKIPDVMAERPILIFGKWMDSRAGGKITVKGVAGHQELKVEVPIEKFMEPDTSQALKYLWARYQLKLLADYHGLYGLDTLKKQIIDIGLKYNLLTEFTSFVAVDYEMRNDGKTLTTVKQPLPLPEGVSDYAVGGGSGEYAKLASMPTSVRSFDALDESINAPKEHSNETEEDNSYSSDQKGDNTNTVPDKQASFSHEELKKFLVYPPMARVSGLEGEVVVEVTLNRYGIVLNTNILKSTDKMFEETALYAIRRISYNPAIKDGKPIMSKLTIPIKFKLSDVDINVNKISDYQYLVSSGVEYEVIRPGVGDNIKKGDKVAVHINGYLDDCTKIIDTKEYGMWQFEYGDPKILLGLQDGMIGMKRAEQRKIYVPAELAIPYSEKVPEGKGMILEIELVRIDK